VFAWRPYLITRAGRTKLWLPTRRVSCQRRELHSDFVAVRETGDPCAQVLGTELRETRRLFHPHVVVVPREHLLVGRRQLLPVRAVGEISRRCTA
jgi:hypothetical protein